MFSLFSHLPSVLPAWLLWDFFPRREKERERERERETERERQREREREREREIRVGMIILSFACYPRLHASLSPNEGPIEVSGTRLRCDGTVT